jgi:hypothetical protein
MNHWRTGCGNVESNRSIGHLSSTNRSSAAPFDCSNKGKTAQEIRAIDDVATVGYVYAYQRSIRALRGDDGALPDRPSTARGVAQAFRRMLKRAQFSDDVASDLRNDLVRLEQIVTDEGAVTAETESAIAETRVAEEQLQHDSTAAIAGVVYVYSLPHYLRFRVDETTSRTYLKVGKTMREPGIRLAEQARATGLPEDPVLLRYYRDDSERATIADLERTFHSLLTAADHDRARSRSAGMEWFTTSVKFTDAIAQALGLTIVEVSSLGD